MITRAEGNGDGYIADVQELASKIRKAPGCLAYIFLGMIGSPDKLFAVVPYENTGSSTPRLLVARKATAHLVKRRDSGRRQGSLR
jgi:hypothetical protein